MRGPNRCRRSRSAALARSYGCAARPATTPCHRRPWRARSRRGRDKIAPGARRRCSVCRLFWVLPKKANTTRRLPPATSSAHGWAVHFLERLLGSGINKTNARQFGGSDFAGRDSPLAVPRQLRCGLCHPLRLWRCSIRAVAAARQLPANRMNCNADRQTAPPLFRGRRHYHHH